MKSLLSLFVLFILATLATTTASAQYKSPEPPEWMTKSVGPSGPFGVGPRKTSDKKPEKVETPEEKQEKEIKLRLEAMIASTKGQIESALYAEVFRRQKKLLETLKGESLRLAQARLKRFEADKKLDIELHLIVLRQYFRAQVEGQMAQMELIRMDAERQRELRDLQRR